MTQERISLLRQRMTEDMRIKGMGDKAQKTHIRALKDFTSFFRNLSRDPITSLGRSGQAKFSGDQPQNGHDIVTGWAGSGRSLRLLGRPL